MDNRTEVLRIEGLTPEALHDLMEQFPELKQNSKVEPEEAPVGEDYEFVLLTLVVTIVAAATATAAAATAGVNLATAIIKYLEANDHQGKIETTSPPPDQP